MRIFEGSSHGVGTRVGLYLHPQALEPDLRPVTGSHFARPGKSAAAAAITLSTQGVNE